MAIGEYNVNKAFAGILATVLGSSVTASETYMSAKDLASKVVTGDSYQIPSSEGYKVLMVQRKATGDAEVHTDMNDTIIIQQGHGEFLVGGSIKGNHQIAPTEWRGGGITGGHRYTVSVGDLLLIPAGIPHKAFVTDSPFTYLAIKTPLTKAAK
jgi:mannose-6-phosphate isomerase-like protein (cupin superfamily)